MHHPINRPTFERQRSVSTSLKPTTAVRIRSLPWNAVPMTSDSTTNTSHSRMTSENLYGYHHRNVKSNLGSKPSTSKTNLQDRFPNATASTPEKE